MTDSEFWRDLEAKFQALQPSGVIGSYLTASWTSGVWNQTGAQWLLSASDPQVKEEFVSLAEEAAERYGRTTLIQNADERWKLSGEAALFFWLDVLKRETGKYKSDHGPVRNADGSNAEGERGKINRVCAASAVYCGKLARRGAAPAGSDVALRGFREVEKEPIRMERPSRSEIDESADKAFAVDRKRILAEYETKLDHLPAQVGLTGNSGGYLPALIKWGEERVREMILAWVDARVEAFTSYGVPSETRVETDLKAFAQQITAGSIAAIRGQLKLRSVRLRIAEEGGGVPWHLEIEKAMGDALDEGLLRLEKQRIKFRDAGKPLKPGFTAVARVRAETAASPQAFGTPKADEVAAVQPATAANPDFPGRGQRGSVHKPDKGNVGLLRGTDGKLKRAVTLDVARRFGGVSRRAIEKAAKKDLLRLQVRARIGASS